MRITLSDKKQGTAAIAGHVGCGHCHSLNSQVQDDSAGLATVLAIFHQATGLDMRLKDIRVTNHHQITATMENGGVGHGWARRAVTPQEEKLLRGLIGREICCTHTLVLETFGRFYGQGISETPVAVQTALANAAVNGFVVNYPDRFVHCTETLGENMGEIAGTVLNIDGADVSVLATVNATRGGLGPMEDLEGNSDLDSKKAVIEALGMDHLPTIVVEAVVYSSFSQGLTEDTYFIRGDEEDDNPFVVRAFLEAARKLQLPVRHHQGGMRRTPGALRKNTQTVADKVIALGRELRQAESGEEKVRIVSELALAVSQDCGGITFMSNDVHGRLGGAGMIPRTSAVFNLVVCDATHEENPIPWLSGRELVEYAALTLETARILASDEEALRHITGNELPRTF